MVSRRLFLGQCSAASACALSQSISPSAAREALSFIFEIADTPHEDPARWQTFGRIVIRRLKDSVSIEDGFAVHDGKQENCEFSFSARTPEGVEEVQIWAGIRCRDRDSRYVFALRGGKNDDVYLARYAPDGQARFPGIAPLDFHPEPGTWYQLRLIAQGDRIRIYVNGENLPRLNVRDDIPLWSEGGVSLGGSWLPVQFRDVSVKPLSTDGSAGAEQDAERPWLPARVDQAEQRAVERGTYRPIVLGALDKPRTELSLNGQWLFIPVQELTPAARHVPR